MNRATIHRYCSGLCQIACSAAMESGSICRDIHKDPRYLQTESAMSRRHRRLILHSIYTPALSRCKKKRYRITQKRKIIFPADRYLYICKKLSSLADRQSKILLLCRIYRIPAHTLFDLFAGQALAFTMIYYHLSHESNARTDELCYTILQLCQEIVHGAEEFAWSNGRQSDHRVLMRRDIADEFRVIADGILEILTLTLISEGIKET